MSHQHMLQGGITVVLIILWVGCGGNAPASVSEAPATMAAPEQAATTLASEPTSPTPESPTATPSSEPATSTPEPPTATPTIEPVTVTLTPESPPTTEEEPVAEPLEVGNPERGREIFENGGEKYTDKPQYHCIRCHSLDGSEGDGPSLQGISQQAGNRVPELSAVEYLRQSILEPDAYIIEGFSHQMGRIHSVLLNEEEINDLVAFMLTQ